MKFKLTIGAFIGFVALAVSIFFAAVVAVIDYRVTSKLDGVLWTVPAKIYSRPLELAEGFNFNRNIRKHRAHQPNCSSNSIDAIK